MRLKEVSQICYDSSTRGQPPISVTGHWRFLSYIRCQNLKTSERRPKSQRKNEYEYCDKRTKRLKSRVRYIIHYIYALHAYYQLDLTANPTLELANFVLHIQCVYHNSCLISSFELLQRIGQ